MANLFKPLPGRRQLIWYGAVFLIGASLIAALLLGRRLGQLDRTGQVVLTVALAAYWLAAAIGLRLFLQGSNAWRRVLGVVMVLSGVAYFVFGGTP